VQTYLAAAVLLKMVLQAAVVSGIALTLAKIQMSPLVFLVQVSTKDYKDVKATGADVTYRKKGTSVGVEVSRGRFTPSFDGNPTTGI
jgi:hypothetical protein